MNRTSSPLASATPAAHPCHNPPEPGPNFLSGSNKPTRSFSPGESATGADGQVGVGGVGILSPVFGLLVPSPVLEELVVLSSPPVLLLLVVPLWELSVEDDNFFFDELEVVDLVVDKDDAEGLPTLPLDPVLPREIEGRETEPLRTGSPPEELPGFDMEEEQKQELMYTEEWRETDWRGREELWLKRTLVKSPRGE